MSLYILWSAPEVDVYQLRYFLKYYFCRNHLYPHFSAHLFQRVDVTERVRVGMNLDDVEREFGKERLVVVANESRRWMALFGGEADPLLLERLSDIQYCIMERIGRSRYKQFVTL